MSPAEVVITSIASDERNLRWLRERQTPSHDLLQRLALDCCVRLAQARALGLRAQPLVERATDNVLDVVALWESYGLGRIRDGGDDTSR